MSAPIFQAVQPDGRIMVYGGTYDYRDAIRAHGGRWDADTRAWYLPAGTDTAFLPPEPASVAVAPKPVPLAVKPREEWTATEWASYVFAMRSARRYVVGACCTHAQSFYDYAQGPTHYRCARHGETRCDYAGD
jgi:hypothetical protein